MPLVMEEEQGGLTGTQLFLKQQHLVTEGLDPVAPAPQLGHLFWLQLLGRHGQYCSDPGPSPCGPLQRKVVPQDSGAVPGACASPVPLPTARLLQPLQPRPQLCDLPPQVLLLTFRFSY